MNDEKTSPRPTQDKPAYQDEVSPDALMNDFKGKPIARIVIFTVIIHAVFICLFSFGYIRNEVLGEDTAELSEEERMKEAVRESTAALQDIAEKYEIKLRDLSKAFVDEQGLGGSAKPAEDSKKTNPPPADGGTPPAGDGDGNREGDPDAGTGDNGAAPKDPTLPGDGDGKGSGEADIPF